MANFKNSSRYSTATATTNRENKSYLVLRNPIKLKPDQGDTFLTVTAEILQRPDLISQTFYGSTEYWWVIYEFNNIRDPFFELKLGQVLRIPALERVLTAISAIGE